MVNVDCDVNVLLVEDNLGDVRLVREFLQDTPSMANVRLSHAGNLSEAIAYLEHVDLDAILLDLSLPDSKGLSTLEKIQHLFPKVPIVIMSGLEDEAVALRAVQAGAQDYLVKSHCSGHLLNRALFYAMERKSAEVRLAYLAQYDVLTDLPNRALFRDRLMLALQRAIRNQSIMALFFLDLDHFKDINDSLGHEAGDQLLKATAKRFLQCTRKSDTVARLGGDEFTIILEDITNHKDIEITAEKIIHEMSKPFFLAGREIYVTTSIGMADYPRCGIDEDTLLKNADMALYIAKDNGRSHYCLYDPASMDPFNNRVYLVNELRRALVHEEFKMMYQPVVDATTGAITGNKTSLCWLHPEKGILELKDFILVAEEIGIILPISQWALITTIKQYRRWLDEGYRPPRLSFKLCRRQLRQHDFVKQVVTLLNNFAVPPALIQFDINENDLAADITQTINELHRLGIEIAISGFGCGYSSVIQLSQMSIDLVKIDATFIANSEIIASKKTVIQALIHLAHSLGCNVVAEDITTEQQRNLLTILGCDAFQESFLSAPKFADDCHTWLQGRLAQPCLQLDG